MKVSVLGLGCNYFGLRCEEARSAAVVQGLDAGVTVFDTAELYGSRCQRSSWAALAGRHEVGIAMKFGTLAAWKVDDAMTFRGEVIRAADVRA